MDLIFGSAGVAAADQERMREINREIGLDRMVQGGYGSEKDYSGDEKRTDGHGVEIKE